MRINRKMAKRKPTVETDNSNWKAPKTRKKRKPMSDEQRAAAAERLAKAREKRAEKNPDYGKSGLHESIRDLPDKHHIHPDKGAMVGSQHTTKPHEYLDSIKNTVKKKIGKRSGGY